MFASQAVKALPDLTLDLSEPLDWQVGALKTVQYHLDVTAISTEPTSGLFAVGMWDFRAFIIEYRFAGT